MWYCDEHGRIENPEFDDPDKHKVITAYCPICGVELRWIPISQQ